MTKKNQALAALHSKVLPLTLPDGRVLNIKKLRPLDVGADRVLDFLDGMAELFKSQNAAQNGSLTLNAASVRTLLRHCMPGTNLHTALQDALPHFTGEQLTLAELDADELTAILLAIVEHNLSFFAQTVPSLMHRLTARAVSLATPQATAAAS